jgi:DNA (cytosine-5)-methyltransferase 1
MSLRNKPEKRSGPALRKTRLSLGLTQAQLGKELGYSARQIARWETGNGRIREAVAQYMLSLGSDNSRAEPSAFTFVDLFAGIGGFHLGFRSAGGRCVFTCEWDRWAQKTYRANFPGHDIHGDIRDIKAHEIPEHNILLAGFPCQPFSIAGVSKKNALGRKHGFECETQGTLFFELERIIAAKTPMAFVLENVKNLASHDHGRTFDVIMRTLDKKLDYEVSPKIVDARRFVPQHRERVFIVGVRRDLKTKFDWDRVELPAESTGPRLGAILHANDGSEVSEERFTDSNGRPLPKYVLSDHLWGYLQSYALKHQAAGNGFGFGLAGPDDVARTLSARYFKDGSEILIRRSRGAPRRLTPRECARLMGFDRPGREPFRIVVSDTQAYRQFGNAVVVPVVEAIAKVLAPIVTAATARAKGRTPRKRDAA